MLGNFVVDQNKICLIILCLLLVPTYNCSSMSLREGLVRRKNVQDVPSKFGDSARSNSEDSGKEDYDDDDSKGTRLTLMEEVLLLGLKDKEVRLT